MNRDRRLGIYTRIALITGVSVVISITIAALLAAISSGGLGPVAAIAAFICPILIAVPASFVMLNQSSRISSISRELDVTRRRLDETRVLLEHRSNHDQMTGLTNRETFIGIISRARRVADNGFLMIVETDRLKEINDHHGHLVGDQALIAIARVISGHIREGDLAARISGKEFSVFLPGASLAEAIQVSERIRQAVEELNFVSPTGDSIPLTVSLGGAEKIENRALDSVLSKADNMLDQAISSGGNHAIVVPEIARAA